MNVNCYSSDVELNSLGLDKIDVGKAIIAIVVVELVEIVVI